MGTTALVRLAWSSAFIAGGLIAFAGCGGGADDGGTERSSSGRSSTARAASALLAEAAHQFAQVESYRFTAVEVVDGYTTNYSGDVRTTGEVRFTKDTGVSHAEMVLTPDARYIKANLVAWQSGTDDEVANRRLRRLAGRWVRQAPDADTDADGTLGEASPERMAKCLGDVRGTLRQRFSQTFRGEPALVLQSDASPMLYWVTRARPTRLLRYVQTGPMEGRRSKACGGEAIDGSVSRVELTFSDYDRVAPIRPPRGARSMEDLLA